MSLLLSIPLFVTLNGADLYSSKVGESRGGIELGIGDKPIIKAFTTGVQIWGFEHCGKKGKIIFGVGSVIGYGLIVKHNMNVGKK